MSGNTKGRRRRWGSVRKLPSSRYQARYPDPNGELHNAPYTFPTQTDADVWLVDKEAEIRRNGWHDPNGGKVRLDVYASGWLTDRPELAPRTTADYEYVLRRHVAPYLGAYELGALSAPVIRGWRRQLVDAGVGAATVAKAYRVLRAMLNTAVEDGLIRQNPCRVKGAGTIRSKERRVPTADQVVAAAMGVAARYRVLVLLAAFGALRWGELAALRRSDLDLRKMTVKVERSMVELSGHLSEGLTKSVAGQRTVNLPKGLKPVVQHHLAEWAEAGKNGRVFVGPQGGTLRRSNFQDEWNKARTAAGAPELRFHDLRHAGATWAAQAGATIRELQERLGHASPQAAMIYQHAATDRGQVVADRLGDLLPDDLARIWHEDDSEEDAKE